VGLEDGTKRPKPQNVDWIEQQRDCQPFLQEELDLERRRFLQEQPEWSECVEVPEDELQLEHQHPEKEEWVNGLEQVLEDIQGEGSDLFRLVTSC